MKKSTSEESYLTWKLLNKFMNCQKHELDAYNTYVCNAFLSHKLYI